METERKVESGEQQLADSEFFAKWSQELDNLSFQLGAIIELPGLVDIIKSANQNISEIREIRRRSLKSNRDDPEFTTWIDNWSNLKYQALITTLKWRQAGEINISVGRFISRNEKDIKNGRQEKLIFQFNLDRNFYKTETSFINLTLILPSDQLTQLIGSYDQVSRGSRPRTHR